MTFVRFVIAAVIAAQAAPAFAIDTARVERIDDRRVAISWTASAPVDVYTSDRPDATVRTARRVARADADGQFEAVAPGQRRTYFLLRDTGTGAVLRTAERLVPLAQGSNFRDIGGYAAADGKHVRWGMIYRSGATPLLTPDDLARVRALGLKNMVDLRSSEERRIAPTRITGVRYAAVDYAMMTMMGDRSAMTNGSALYRNFPAFFAPQLKIVFDDLLKRRGPLVYNCSAGQDRTGFTTAMILSALGVSRETIVADYHLSTAYRQPRYELPPIDEATAKSSPVAGMFAAFQKSGSYAKAQPLKDAEGRPFLDGAFAEIEQRWGSVDAFLAKEVGVTLADLATLRAAYLE